MERYSCSCSTSTSLRPSRSPHRPLYIFGKFERSNGLVSQIHCTDTHSQWMPCSQYIFVCWLWYDYYEVLWFALIYSERCTRTYTIKTWSTFWRIIYLLMSSECIQIWLGTHFTKQEMNAPSRCRSLFPNSSVKTQQLDSSRNVGNNAFMLIAHTAVRSTNTFFSMSLFALLMPQSTFG